VTRRRIGARSIHRSTEGYTKSTEGPELRGSKTLASGLRDRVMKHPGYLVDGRWFSENCVGSTSSPRPFRCPFPSAIYDLPSTESFIARPRDLEPVCVGSKSRSPLDSVPSPSFCASVDGSLLVCNPSARRVEGYPPWIAKLDPPLDRYLGGPGTPSPRWEYAACAILAIFATTAIHPRSRLLRWISTCPRHRTRRNSS
jgi:hypothetical protein